MKIGVVCFPSVGGSGFVASALAIELAYRGHQVNVISSDKPYLLKDINEPNLKFHKVECEEYELFKYPDYTTLLANKIVDLGKNENLDIVNVHYAIPHAIAAYLAKQVSGIPYVATLHGTDVHTFGAKPEFQPVLAKALNEAHCVTAVCDFLASEASRIWNLDGIQVIRNFLDLTNLKNNDESLELRLGEPSLLHVSNFRNIKKVNDLVEGMPYVLEEIPSATLNLIGDGPELPRVKERINEYGLENSVRCWGFQKYLSPFFQQSHIFVLSSDLEGAPLTLIEAMYHGVPAVASDVGGVSEIVKHGLNGYTFRNGDKRDYSRKVIKVWQDQTAYNAMRQKSREFVAKEHSTDVIIQKYESVFRGTLAKCKL